MSTSFAKAPLVEIIAELRWVPPQVPEQASSTPFPFVGDTKQEEFFMRMGSELRIMGFKSPERLLPPGFVTLLHQPAYRFKRERGPSPVLYQVGPGVFSAHGLPPYSSWDNFSPDVENGVQALIQARDASEREAPFSRVALRYIDGFSHELTGGRDELSFLKDVLGISIGLPASVVELAEPGSLPRFKLQMSIPAANRLTMNVNIAEGNVKGAPAIVMDTTVSTDRGVPARTEQVMDVLHSERAIIHKAFFDLTQPIHALMEPREV